MTRNKKFFIQRCILYKLPFHTILDILHSKISPYQTPLQFLNFFLWFWWGIALHKRKRWWRWSLRLGFLFLSWVRLRSRFCRRILPTPKLSYPRTIPLNWKVILFLASSFFTISSSHLNWFYQQKTPEIFNNKQFFKNI